MIGQTSTTEQASEVRHARPEVLAARELLAKPSESLPRRARRPRDIAGHDEAALSWFFGQGLSIYDKSTFGPIVQKIQMDGYASTTCGRCEGAGIVDDAGGVTLDDKCKSCDGGGLAPRKAGDSQQWCLTCDGLGRVPPYEVEMASGGWCPSCRGTGCGSVERRAMRVPRCQWCKPDPVTVTDEATDTTLKLELVAARVPTHSCPNCLGTGNEPITAKRVTKDDEGGGVLGNDVALTRFAITSRRADRVKAISPALHAALEAFYGDVGHRWANSPFGRLFALYHLTPAGRRLAKMGLVHGEQTGKTKKKKARKLEQLIADALSRGKRADADRLAKEQADRRVTSPKPRDTELAVVQLNAQERIGVQAVLQQRQHDKDRKEALDAAHDQASALYQRAARAWNGVATPKADIEADKRLDANLTRLGHGELAKKIKAGGAR